DKPYVTSADDSDIHVLIPPNLMFNKLLVNVYDDRSFFSNGRLLLCCSKLKMGGENSDKTNRSRTFSIHDYFHYKQQKSPCSEAKYAHQRRPPLLPISGSADGV